VEQNKIGNSVLGYAKESTGGFIPKYVGRSDSDLKMELLEASCKLQLSSHDSGVREMEKSDV
jgi:hypothetical protein